MNKSGSLYLSKPNLKGWALQFEAEDELLVLSMRSELWKAVISEFLCIHAFFQCDGANYLMIEFWSDDQDKILSVCMNFANSHGYELELR
jgi:hypothetical protein